MATSSRKSTDLERLTQPGGKVMPDDATIPVLTERLTLPSLDLDISLPQPPPPVVAPQSSVPPTASPPPPPVAALLMPKPEVESPRPAARPAPPPSTLFASVASVAPDLCPRASASAAAGGSRCAGDRLGKNGSCSCAKVCCENCSHNFRAELERQVRERLQPTLVRALTALISDLRPALDSTVRETIARAISTELARQRSALK